MSPTLLAFAPVTEATFHIAVHLVVELLGSEYDSDSDYKVCHSSGLAWAAPVGINRL